MVLGDPRSGAEFRAGAAAAAVHGLGEASRDATQSS